MKKLVLSSIFGFAAFGVSAQSFHILDAGSQTVTNGSTITYYVDQTTALETHDFEVHNMSSSPVTAKVRKAIQSQADPGCTFYFCTNQNCYTPNTVLSGNVAMNAGASFQLITDFTPNNAIGTSLVRYSVFNTANPSDSAYFFIEYIVGQTSVNNLSMVKANIGTPNPNPASSVFSMNYNLGSSFGKGEAKLVIYNMLGAVVRTESLSDMQGTMKMDVSTLENGVYFTSMEVDGKQVATKRLVVSH